MLNFLSTLSPAQYTTVLYAFLATALLMTVSAGFFVLSRRKVEGAYRPALWMVAAIVTMSALHYIFLAVQWRGVYELQGAFYTPDSASLPLALYRYVYWLPTVPLLLISLVNVLDFPKQQARSLGVRLTLATVAMIVLGYPGEISTDMQTRAIWGTASTVPFLYILWVLYGMLNAALTDLTEEVSTLVTNSVLLLLGSWGFFPIIYMLPFLGISGGNAEVGVQLGYMLADWLAKAGFSFLIYSVAREQSLAEYEYEDEAYDEYEDLDEDAVALG